MKYTNYAFILEKITNTINELVVIEDWKARIMMMSSNLLHSHFFSNKISTYIVQDSLMSAYPLMTTGII